jgi:hypothetical protein
MLLGTLWKLFNFFPDMKKALVGTPAKALKKLKISSAIQR